jgi:biopolymer transport protein ExbD
MSTSSPLGSGLYFVDVLACLLFCLSLALVGARFGREVTVPVELPRIERAQARGSETTAVAIAVRNRNGQSELFLEGEPLSLEELEARLASAPPPRVVVRPEDSLLARVVGAAHAAGVRDIELAYEAGLRREGEP